MDITTISIFVAIISAVSASAERLVEILQNLVGGGVSPETNSDPEQERKRKAKILCLSFICCEITSYLSVPFLFQAWDKTQSAGPIVALLKSWFAPMAIGVLAMGGSSFWNSIQGYLNGIKKSVQPISDALKQAQKKISAAEKLDDLAGKIISTEQTEVDKKTKLQNDAKALRDEAARQLANIGSQQG